MSLPSLVSCRTISSSAVPTPAAPTAPVCRGAPVACREWDGAPTAPVCRGRLRGTTGGVVFGEGSRHEWVDLCEQALGGYLVAVFEVGKLAGHGFEKELGDEPSAVGVLQDDMGEGACLELDELS